MDVLSVPEEETLGRRSAGLKIPGIESESQMVSMHRLIGQNGRHASSPFDF